MSAKARGILAVTAVALAALFAWISQYVWIPDMISPRASVLASGSTQSGHRFQVVQYWNGADFYTTELEDMNPSGQLTVAQINWDDMKQWSCTMKVVEAEKKVVVTFPSEPHVWEYRWDLGYIVAPHDYKDIPFKLNTRERSRLLVAGEVVQRTKSLLTEAGERESTTP